MRRIGTLTIVCAIALAVMAAPAGAASWRVVRSADVNGDFNELDGVSASATDAWAVGTYRGSDKHFHPLAEHWDGTRWRLRQPRRGAGDGFLSGVADVTAGDAWAVGHAFRNGHDVTLTEHWDGTAWSIVRTPRVAPSSELNAVTAIGPDDVWAVGDSAGQTLTEHWDGSTWTVVPSPNGGPQQNRLLGVGGLDASHIWAVGTNGNEDVPMAMRWNGSAWTIVATQTNGESGLRAVSPLAPNDIWSVGFSRSGSHAMAEHDTGSGFVQVPIQDPPDTIFDATLTGVVARTTHDVWATGIALQGGAFAHALAEHWNGAAWSIVDLPDAGADDALLGLAPAASGGLWAVGYRQPAIGDQEQTLIMRNG